jgi:hypothetical protein
MKNAPKLKAMHLNLDPAVHAALMELADATGIPASQYVGQVLRASVSDIAHLAAAARTAQAAFLSTFHEHRLELQAA